MNFSIPGDTFIILTCLVNFTTKYGVHVWVFFCFCTEFCFFLALDFESSRKSVRMLISIGFSVILQLELFVLLVGQIMHYWCGTCFFCTDQVSSINLEVVLYALSLRFFFLAIFLGNLSWHYAS
ncbi:hypothetical protein ACP275_03G020100 [Erythranthe tilingii]